MAMQKRLQKELMALRKDTPPGMKVDFDNITTHGEDTQIFVDIEGPKDSLYVGETFRLRFRFSPQYPFEAPEVVFVGLSPSAAHFYSNGHVCLSILTEDWSPALSVQSVCLSIISMLSSSKEKRRPADDAFYVRTCSKSPKKTKWWYHDDSV